ncbi:MAG: hypothetical protein H8E66_15315 [Planctomycetes bacterium]|nr:hypothetical protein [Planctomycetota bacterium]
MNSAPPAESDQSTGPTPDREGIFQAELAVSARRPTRSPLARGLLFLCFMVGIAIPIVLFWLPSEQANWQIAAAQAKWLDGDLVGAIETLDAATVRYPDNTTVYEQRFEFLLEAKEFEKALDDAQQLVKASPKSAEAIGLQSQALHHLGRHNEAIERCAEVLRLADEEWIGSAPNARNSLAYAQAIGDTQLDKALEHIEEALRLLGDNPAMLDTRGFIKYRLGDSKAARDDIEQAVASFEMFVAHLEARQFVSVRSYQSEAERLSYQQALAVMLYHRSLVYDRLGMQDKAKVDRERVRGLGHEPNASLF